VTGKKKGLKDSDGMSKLPFLFSQMKNLRVFTGTVTMLAWFVISNHCMLDAAISPTVEAVSPDDCCPMHASMPGHPAKPKEDRGLQLCCKNLPATALKSSQHLFFFVASFLASYFDQDPIFAPGRDERPLLCLGTGPPGAFSFSELVLQRSLRAHAPPTVA
jgi:hypothetical protein